MPCSRAKTYSKQVFHQVCAGEIQMSENNKAILEQANAAIAQGNYEGFLSFCTDDTEWIFVGDKTLKEKAAVRQWMATEYVEPPLNIVVDLIAEGDFVTAVGDLTIKDKDGKAAHSRTATSGASAAARWSN
jgi:ketosteroid isomerase-like protein